MYLHRDNCSGQNKNNTMLHYLLWRSMTGLHTKITLSFLVVGHTKFAPDWCFGLVKRLYRKTKIGSLMDIAKVVDDSAVCNVSQLVSDETGIVVPTRDWTSFFAPRMKKIQGIKKYHHFHFDSTNPGVVGMKVQSDSLVQSIQILKEEWSPQCDDLPAIVPPKHFSAERQWYLYNSIRPFCPDGDKDVTCPLPQVPRVGSRNSTPVRSPSPARIVSPPQELSPLRSAESTTTAQSFSPATAAPPSKRSRRCGKCKKMGHNSRSCKQ